MKQITYEDVIRNEKQSDKNYRKFKRSDIHKFYKCILFTAQTKRCISCDRHIHLDNTDDELYASVDHIMPRSLGGSNTSITNMALMCKKCNSRKADKLPSNRLMNKHAIIQRRVKFILDLKLQFESYKFNELLNSNYKDVAYWDIMSVDINGEILEWE